MAIVKNSVDSRIKLTYDYGVNEEGNAVIRIIREDNAALAQG